MKRGWSEVTESGVKAWGWDLGPLLSSQLVVGLRQGCAGGAPIIGKKSGGSGHPASLHPCSDVFLITERVLLVPNGQVATNNGDLITTLRSNIPYLLYKRR